MCTTVRCICTRAGTSISYPLFDSFSRWFSSLSFIEWFHAGITNTDACHAQITVFRIIKFCAKFVNVTTTNTRVSLGGQTGIEIEFQTNFSRNRRIIRIWYEYVFNVESILENVITYDSSRYFNRTRNFYRERFTPPGKIGLKFTTRPSNSQATFCECECGPWSLQPPAASRQLSVVSIA